MPDPAMALLNALLDWEFEAQVAHLRATHARVCREESMLDEARAIVAAGDDAACTAEHLRIVLARLDRATSPREEQTQ